MNDRFWVKMNPMSGAYYIFDNELGVVVYTKILSYEDASDLAIKLNETYTHDSNN